MGAHEGAQAIELTLQANRLAVLADEHEKGNKRIRLEGDSYFWYQNEPAVARTFGSAVKAPRNHWVEYCAETGKVIAYGNGRKTTVYDESKRDVGEMGMFQWANNELMSKFYHLVAMKEATNDSDD